MAKKEKIIGIDLGTSNSAADMMHISVAYNPGKVMTSGNFL